MGKINLLSLFTFGHFGDKVEPGQEWVMANSDYARSPWWCIVKEVKNGNVTVVYPEWNNVEDTGSIHSFRFIHNKR